MIVSVVGSFLNSFALRVNRDRNMGGQKDDNVIGQTESAVSWGVRQVMGLAALADGFPTCSGDLCLCLARFRLCLCLPPLPAHHGRRAPQLLL